MGTAMYCNRQKLEMSTWPELGAALGQLGFLIRGPGQLAPQLKDEVLTVSSIAAGCVHCQAHGAYGLHLAGVDVERIGALWDFENSEAFSPAELAALRLARAASVTPNAVSPAHFEALREHYSDRQIVELLSVVALNGFLNRYNDSAAVVTDQQSVDWATENLGVVGWEIGKHAGSPDEQRATLPPFMQRLAARAAGASRPGGV